MRKSIQRQGPMLAALMAALSLAGCAQFEIADRSVEYNLAIETASNRMLLLNAVRASKRYPMHFTAITDVNMSSPVSGSLGFNIPFGGDAKNTFTITPSTTASSGIKTSLGVLNKQELFRGITTPIKGETFHFYLLQGWPRELLFYMFIRKIDLKSKQTHDDIIGASDRRCDKEEDKKNPDELCDFAPFEETLGMVCKDPIAQFDKDNGPYTNQPGNPCKFMRFQDLIRRLRILDFDVVRKTSTKDVIEKTVTKVSEGPQGKTKVTKTEVVKKGFVTYSLIYKADFATFEPDIQLKLSRIDFSENIMFSELPGGARLSAGTPKGGGRWILKSDELKKLENGLRVTQPSYSAKAFKLAYSGKTKDDKLVKGTIEMTVKMTVRMTVKKTESVMEETEELVKLSAIQEAPPAAETVRPVPVAPPPEVFLRSPEAMIFYMGGLLEVQNRPLKKVVKVTEDNLRDIAYTPQITLGSGPKRKKVNLFRVIKGEIAGAAAVTVSHEGDTYHIPRVKKERGRSMHVLSLVSQIFALHRSSKELPSTSTIRVISD